ncbi:MAG: methylenetetrahydrofolate reductase, partial [Succiniclasticum sp.]
MKIINLLKGTKPGVSCELFPPKQGSQLANALEIVDTIAEQKPSFISVTYGAGGKSEPPSPGEVIYRDDFGAVCRCWNWR